MSADFMHGNPLPEPLRVPAEVIDLGPAATKRPRTRVVIGNEFFDLSQVREAEFLDLRDETTLACHLSVRWQGSGKEGDNWDAKFEGLRAAAIWEDLLAFSRK